MPESIVPSQKCRMCLKLNPPGSRFCNYCGNDLSFAIQPDGLLPEGAVLRGSYVIEGVIGEGGMGVVYSCHHKSLGTRYALKVLDPKLARMDILRRRFLDEAKIQATVVHPHIVHVMDVIDSDKDGGIPGILAIVMEYVEGEALDQIIERHTLSEHDAVSSALVILDAIGFAHHAHIVHRDLKPSNIMVSRAESQETLYCGIKVMDFGIAKLLQENDQRTVTGAKMGTPRYMAPEQIENARDVDERTDLYAIGLTLYEMLCGRTPFEEFKEFELLKAQLSMKPPSMRTYRSDVSDRLEAIVMKSLEKDRANRYPNAESFQRALLSLGGYDDISLRLNPNDGALVVQSNPKLQRKIERAIAKSGEGAKKIKPSTAARGGGSVGGPDARAQGGSVAPEAHVPVKAVPQKSASPAKQRTVSRNASMSHVESIPSAPAGTDAAKGRGDAHPASPSHKSMLQIAREKQPSGVHSRTFRRSRSAVSLAAAAQIKSSHNKSVRPQSAPSVRQLQSGEPSVPTRPAAKNATVALKIVVVSIVILACVGLVYRFKHSMSAPAPQLEVLEPMLAGHDPVKVQNIAALPLETMHTDTGVMTVVPAAEHWIGVENSKTLRRVALPSFAIDQVEVSYFQYFKCVEAGKCPVLAWEPPDWNMPVTGIGVGSAEAFCAFAGKSLPNVEQWEAAGRFGGDHDGITDVNVSCETIHCGSGKNGECRRVNPEHPESVFRRMSSANPGHIVNMLGNVREWTSTPGADPQTRVTKGGSYRTRKADIRMSAGWIERANQGVEDLGFRCVRAL